MAYNRFINWKEKELSAFGGMNAYDVAQKGFEQHKSQVAYFSMSLNDRSRYGNGLFGLYSSTVGPDVEKNDFLENIPEESLTTWIPPEPEPEPDPIPTTDTENSDASTNLISNESEYSNLTLLATLVILGSACVFVLIGLIVFLIARNKK